MKDYYSLLEVPANANRHDIQAAYRRLAKKYHPDVNKSPDAHEKFCEITEAYEFLMNHWPARIARFPNTDARDRKYATDDNSEEYRKFRQESRERAQKQAKMRYEKFRQQHEAFQTSGINDLALLLKIALRITGFFLFLFLLILPVILANNRALIMIILVIVIWPFAGIIGWYIYDNRKNYFLPGKFYYSLERIRHLFTDIHPSEQSCHYCPGKTADSVPYKIELYKLKNLKISSGGFRQHSVQYINKNACLLVPRSKRAFILHTGASFIKVASVLTCLIFLPLTSFVWRGIAGIAAGGILATLLLAITHTRSNVSFLITSGMIFRAAVWVCSISMASRFFTRPFDIVTTDSIQFVITSIIIFDCLMMQFLDFATGERASLPLVRQFPEVSEKMRTGFHPYNDIPLISVVYPLLKWFFG